MSGGEVSFTPILRKSFQYKTKAELITALAGGDTLQVYSADNQNSPIFFYGAMWSNNIGNDISIWGNNGTLQITGVFACDGGFNAVFRDVALVPNWFDMQIKFGNVVNATLPSYFSAVIYYFLLPYAVVAP